MNCCGFACMVALNCLQFHNPTYRNRNRNQSTNSRASDVSDLLPQPLYPIGVVAGLFRCFQNCSNVCFHLGQHQHASLASRKHHSGHVAQVATTCCHARSVSPTGIRKARHWQTRVTAAAMSKHSGCKMLQFWISWKRRCKSLLPIKISCRFPPQAVPRPSQSLAWHLSESPFLTQGAGNR